MAAPIDVEKLAREVADSNFSDERLTKRLGTLVTALAEDPSRSLPKTFDDAGLEAAYRFFGNHRITPNEILKGHFEATRARCAEQESFLVAHDSTSFSYRYDGDREGLGRASKTSPRSNQMFHAHVSLALTDDEARRPLGIAAFKTWTRGETRSGVEFRRWEEQMREASSRLDGLRSAIHLADREADDYDMFCALMRDRHRFVVRCLTNRLLEDGSQKLHDLFAKISPTAEREVPLSRRTPRRTAILRKIHPARFQRSAKLVVAGAAVTLKRPKRKWQGTPPPETLTINIVRVWEPDPPADAAPIEWYLYTSEPIDTPEQQLKTVDRYRARWRIEEFFKAIKTGCDFESRQLQDYEGLVNLLAVFAPIGYRLLLIRSEAARDPEQSALAIVSADELDVLRTLGRRKLTTTPTAREVYLAIAQLGGYIRYSKSDPGWQTLAAGYEKLETLTLGWRAAKLQPASDQR